MSTEMSTWEDVYAPILSCYPHRVGVSGAVLLAYLRHMSSTRYQDEDGVLRGVSQMLIFRRTGLTQAQQTTARKRLHDSQLLEYRLDVSRPRAIEYFLGENEV